MPRIPLLGGAYQARSVIAEAQRCVNLYPEKNPTDAPTQVTHYPTPGLRFLTGPSPPPPPVTFSALGVNFDGLTLVTNPAISSGTDSGLFSWAIWKQVAVEDDNTDWAVDPTNTDVAFGTDSATGPGTFTNGAFFRSPDLSSGYFPGNSNDLATLVWHQAFGSVDVNHATGSRTANFWIDDANHLIINTNTGTAFTIVANGLPLYVGGDTFNNYVGDLGELIIWFGQEIDWSVTANRRFFLSSGGAPVDPTAGFAALGNPTVYLSRRTGEPASAFGANRSPATGGAFSVSSGTLTASATPPHL